MRKAMAAIRTKSPNAMIHQKLLERWVPTAVTKTPLRKVWPDGMVATLATRIKRSTKTVYRWLDDPDEHPLDWKDLQQIAAEIGGSIRCMFSIKHQ